MAVQNDNTILKKADLKAYHERIAPMLGGTFMVGTNNSDYYSTDEKVVGIWIDGKPLYQKTFDYGGDGVTISNSTWTDLGISISDNKIERIVKSFGQSIGTSNDNCMFWFHTHCESSVTNVHGLAARYNGGLRVKYITLQYTKTTDTAGSATTTPGAYDINFPNTWPANQEIFFGNGMYGYRKTGSGSGVGHTNIGAFGGLTKNGHLMSHGGHLQASNGGNWDTEYFAVETDNTVTIDQTWSTGSMSFTYNLWVTYTK